MNRFESFFQQHPGFANLRNDERLVMIIESAQQRQYQAATTLFRQGEAVDAIYLLISGVALETQKPADGLGDIRSRQVAPGRWLGMYDLVYRRPHSTSASMFEAGQVLSFGPEQIFRLLADFPDHRQELLPIAIINRLRTVPILATLSTNLLGFLAEACQEFELKPGDAVYKEGDPAEKIYIVRQGQVQLHYPGVKDGNRWLGNSAVFGLIEITSKQYWSGIAYPLDHSATAVCATKLFAWSREDFMHITGIRVDYVGSQLQKETSRLIFDLAPFQGFTPAEKTRLAGFFGYYYSPRHQVLMHQGEFADSLWVLTRHKNAMLFSLDKQGNLHKSSATGPTFFNELVLRVQRPYASTLQAEPGSEWLRLHMEDFRAFVDVEAKIKADNASANTGGSAWAKRLKREKKGNDAAQNILKRLKVYDPQKKLEKDRSKEVKFEEFDLQPGEVVEQVQRRHWIIFVRKILFGLALFFALAIVWSILTALGMNQLWFNGLVFLGLSLAGAQMLWGWLDYQNDYILVTNTRVIQQEKVIFFSEHHQTALLEQIRDVRIEKKSVWGNFWSYGTIYIQTSAEKGALVFDFLFHPEALQARILEQQRLRRLHYEAGGKREIYNALERQLGLGTDMPPRVWTPAKAGSAERVEGSLWRLLFARRGRQQLLLEQSSDRILWRKHWIVLLGMTFVPGVLTVGLIGLVVGFIVFYLFSGLLLWGVGAIPAGLLAMFCSTWLWWTVQDWHNDTYEVTNSEIIDTEMKPLLFPVYFDKDVRQSSLSDITNVTYDVLGPLNYILNYGNVIVETAAKQGRFTFEKVPDPAKVADEIRAKIQQFLERQRTEENRRRAREFPVWFEMYERLGIERQER